MHVDVCQCGCEECTLMCVSVDVRMHVDVCQCGCEECTLMCVSVDVRNAR